MKAYELLFFVNPSLDDEARAGVMKRIDSTIVENGGAVESVEDWGGTPVLGMGVAVNDRRRNVQTGQWEDYTNFIDCTMFGARAESLSRILTKGMLVCIEGRLRWSQWERDGQTRSKIEVIVDELELPSRGQGAQDGGAPQAYAPAPQQSYSSQVYDRSRQD